MYPTSNGMRVCDCEAGRSRREYLAMSNEERLQAIKGTRRRKTKKHAEVNKQEEIPF